MQEKLEKDVSFEKSNRKLFLLHCVFSRFTFLKHWVYILNWFRFQKNVYLDLVHEIMMKQCIWCWWAYKLLYWTLWFLLAFEVLPWVSSLESFGKLNIILFIFHAWSFTDGINSVCNCNKLFIKVSKFQKQISCSHLNQKTNKIIFWFLPYGYKKRSNKLY